MWLLSTARAELEFFADPESVEPGYAILSHVWDDKEDTFQDLQILRNRCTETGTNPRDFVSEKIRRSCMLAAAHGLKWVWVDTCCIDKKSSAELSEAINSMFRYYARSRVCYAFLRDVPSAPSSDFEDRNSAFCRSQWHRRGWTLQELIAPKFLIFVSSQWDVLGTKAELAVEVDHPPMCTTLWTSTSRHSPPRSDLHFVSVLQMGESVPFRRSAGGSAPISDPHVAGPRPPGGSPRSLEFHGKPGISVRWGGFLGGDSLCAEVVRFT